MRLKYLSPPMCLLMFGLISNYAQRPPDVVMHVTYEGSKDYLLNITFTSDLFIKFYECLCNGDTSRCDAKYNNNQVQSVKRQKDPKSLVSPCKFYQCKNSRQDVSVYCTVVKATDAKCGQLVKPTFISLPDDHSCDSSCIGIGWTLTQEYLTVNNDDIGARTCDGECCQVTSTSVPTTNLSGSSHSYVSIQHSDDDKDSINTSIVSGIAAGVILMAIIAFVVILLVRRHALGNSPNIPGNHFTRTNSENATALATPGFYANTAVVNYVQKRNQLAHVNNSASGNGFSQSVPASNQSGNVEEDKHKAKHSRWKGFGLSLFPKSDNTQTKRNDKAVDSHTIGSDDDDEVYAVIDESQIQTDLHSSNGTKLASTEDDNAAYNTIENKDYYNTSAVGLSTLNNSLLQANQSSENATDRYNSQQSSNNMQSPAGPNSEYSIARPILDVTAAEEWERHVDKDETASGNATCARDDRTSQISSNPRLSFVSGVDPSEQHLQVDVKKKNPYFELEPEHEEYA